MGPEDVKLYAVQLKSGQNPLNSAELVSGGCDGNRTKQVFGQRRRLCAEI